jgi:hypothetical protein
MPNSCNRLARNATTTIPDKSRATAVAAGPAGASRLLDYRRRILDLRMEACGTRRHSLCAHRISRCHHKCGGEKCQCEFLHVDLQFNARRRTHPISRTVQHQRHRAVRLLSDCHQISFRRVADKMRLRNAMSRAMASIPVRGWAILPQNARMPCRSGSVC